MLRTLLGAVLLLAVGAIAFAAAPPAPIADLIPQLASEDDAIWKAASAKLWKAGDESVPALRKAARSADPDLVLRARVILSRLEAGIRHDTPLAVVAEIERFRDGTKDKKLEAIATLIKLGRPGIKVLPGLLKDETDPVLRKELDDKVREVVVPIARERIVANDLDTADALLAGAAELGDEQALRNLAAFRALLGTAAQSAKQLEQTADKFAARRAVYLSRAAGDLKSARRAAEACGDDDLLGHILEELEDYQALGKLAPAVFKKEPRSHAAMCWFAGDRKGFDDAIKRMPQDGKWQIAGLLFSCDQPKEAIDVIRTDGPSSSLCRLLATQGWRREALTLIPPDKEGEQPGWMLLEQVAIAADVGDDELARQLLLKAQPFVEKFAKDSDGLLGAMMNAGIKARLRDLAFDNVCQAIDKAKPTSIPHYLLSRMHEDRSATMAEWWHFFRKQDADAPLSDTVRRLNTLFVREQPWKDFDVIIGIAEKFVDIPDPHRLKGWLPHVAQVCQIVGKFDRAEDLLKKAAQRDPEQYQALGRFYLERNKPAEAAATYEFIQKLQPTNSTILYLRGVALVRAGKVKEGRALITVARALPLGDDLVRYSLIEQLGQCGLNEEQATEQKFFMQTGAFLSLEMHTCGYYLAQREEQADRHLEAARYYGRMTAYNAFGAGAGYVEDGSYLRVPAYKRQARVAGLAAAGKFAEAQEEMKILVRYLPEEGDAPIALVRALDAAKRSKEADVVFADAYARLKRSVREAPRSGGCNNRIAWLSARCGRRLDEALRHASAGVQARPADSGVRDTLAEVYFQRGEQAAALSHSRRAVALASPGQAYFAAQLKRIEAGDRNATLPPER